MSHERKGNILIITSQIMCGDKYKDFMDFINSNVLKPANERNEEFERGILDASTLYAVIFNCLRPDIENPILEEAKFLASKIPPDILGIGKPASENQLLGMAVAQLTIEKHIKEKFLHDINSDELETLKNFVDSVLGKFRALPKNQWKAAFLNEFPDEYIRVDDTHNVSFECRILPNFGFCIDTHSIDSGEKNSSLSGITIIGVGKYKGFSMMYCGNKGQAVNNSMSFISPNATASARELAQIIEKAFGIKSINKLLGRE